ncbi:AGAP007932-PA-like protein [Anopheles sinensis]|uniref:AGAP007932-PA-like protein n=1 Tax=Anopheles sinensis TaxID=74873 RepID=A0A084VP22_ANOSI|nr:AGAP007932-PA-like protein [Anopheles sinensis]
MLTEVRVPMHTIKGHSVRLECHYNMEGEALYSVKWYKDGREFYRYVPRDDPPGSVFPQPGIFVDLLNSTSDQVVLDTIDLSSSGKYRCEVSAEAPSFQTVSDHGEMLVVVLPEEDPYITGGKPRYQIGDVVRVNCTSGRSKPAVHLTWYINGEAADGALVKQYEPVVSGPDKLETSILGLEFRVKPKHFKRGDMKLKCLATISTVYWKSNEESVEGEKIQKAPMLESRRAVSSDTRADRVQAASSDALANKYSSGLNFTCRLLAGLWLLAAVALNAT